MTIHKFYQTDVNGEVTTAHHVDEKNIINELRKILNNIADTFGQTKFGDDSYPKDHSDGKEFDTNRITAKTGMGTLKISECGFIKLSASGPYTLKLPTAVGNAGRYYMFIKTDANTHEITLDADGGTIDGQATYTGLNYRYACVIFRSDGAEWSIISRTIKNVTDDAQLKRAAGDIYTFAEKTVVANNDIIIIEDSAATYAKKKVKVSDLLGAPAAPSEMGKVLVFNYDSNGDVQPAEDPGPMDVYFERDTNNGLMPLLDLKVPNTINFFFEINADGDIEPREV